jgi:peptidoglycan hydrolase-like protein with peptidoglycan-binding domain
VEREAAHGAHDSALDLTVKLGSRRPPAPVDRYDPRPPGVNGDARITRQTTLNKRSRTWIWVTVGAVVALLAAGGVGFALMRDDSPAQAGDVSDAQGVVDRPSPTTVPESTTTTKAGLVQPKPATLPPIPGGTMGPGAEGDVVKAYQQRLVDLKFDPGPVDGKYGGAMSYAVQALQKIMGVERNGKIGPAEAMMLARFRYPTPLQPDGEPNRTEIDIAKQVLTLYEDGQVRLITTTSSGSGERYCYNSPRVNPTRHICEYANTPSGRFTYREYRDGWDKSPLGQLYNPFYFNGGIAVHGYESVPPYPASHGCTRIPMHIAEYFHTLVHVGDPVYVFGGKPAEIISSTPIAPPPPPPPPPSTAPPVTPTAPPATAPTTTTTTTTAPPTTSTT